MREKSYMISVVSTYCALVLLTLGKLMPVVNDYTADLALGLVIVGVMMMLWHLSTLRLPGIPSSPVRN